MKWFENHAQKHAKIMQKLTHLSDDEVIAYFRYENMVENEPDFCPLYAQGKKCHEMERLNCYLCACPNFRFNDAGFNTSEQTPLKSYCNIDSADGSQIEGRSGIHQNCAGCTVPHHESYIKELFQRNWRRVMQKSPSPSRENR